MSKAFVIKNKEGKYLAVSSGNYEHYWSTIDFAHYFRFLNETHDAKKEAEEFRDGRYPNCEVVEITITEGDLEQENKQLEEQHDLLIDEFQEEREKLCKQIKQESDARERFVEKVKQLKEQLQEQIDYKEEYYHYWQETKKEIAIKEKALKNSCIKIAELDFILNGVIHNDKYWRNKFIKQAKERKMSKAEELLGIKYTELNPQQKKIYQNILKKESRKRNPESIKVNNKKYYEKQKQIITELKQQLAEKDKEIEELKESNRITKALYKNYYTQLQNYKNKLYDIDISKIRKKHLSPEEKEIYYKGFENCERQIAGNIADITIKVRNEICNEIRKKLNDNEHFAFAYLTQKEINKVIDQIEQAKEKKYGI